MQKLDLLLRLKRRKRLKFEFDIGYTMVSRTTCILSFLFSFRFRRDTLYHVIPDICAFTTLVLLHRLCSISCHAMMISYLSVLLLWQWQSLICATYIVAQRFPV